MLVGELTENAVINIFASDTKKSNHLNVCLFSPYTCLVHCTTTVARTVIVGWTKVFLSLSKEEREYENVVRSVSSPAPADSHQFVA